MSQETTNSSGDDFRRMQSPMEKQGLDNHADMLERVRTAGTISMTPEIFEQLYLAPQNRVSGSLRTTFANPTPIAIGGFLLCTTPLSMILLGWQGAGGLGAANNGTYFFLGGLLLLIGGLLEWVLGNTFPATVFTTFGGFWFTFGATLVPSFNAYGAYATGDSVASGLDNPQFYATFAFFLVAMDILCAVYCAAAIRTNVAFFLIFLALIPCFACLAGAFFALSKGEDANAMMLQHVGAGLLLGVTLIGWYIFIALVLAGVDFPIPIPLGDLSTHIPGYSERQKAKREKGARDA